jgi:hypothetical protein
MPRPSLPIRIWMDPAPIIARLAELEATAQEGMKGERPSDVEPQLGVMRALLIGRDARIEKLEAELARTRAASAIPEVETSHLLFFASRGGGYMLIEGAGPSPAPGEEAELDGLTYVVTKRGRAPLPGDVRRCAYLVASPTAPGASEDPNTF